MENKIFYLCDGKISKCEAAPECQNNIGGCNHTSDISHARNFKKVEAKNNLYFEKETKVVNKYESERDDILFQSLITESQRTSKAKRTAEIALIWNAITTVLLIINLFN